MHVTITSSRPASEEIEPAGRAGARPAATTECRVQKYMHGESRRHCTAHQPMNMKAARSALCTVPATGESDLTDDRWMDGWIDH